MKVSGQEVSGRGGEGIVLFTFCLKFEPLSDVTTHILLCVSLFMLPPKLLNIMN